MGIGQALRRGDLESKALFDAGLGIAHLEMGLAPSAIPYPSYGQRSELLSQG
jgi:hypothetical protein